MPPQELPPSIRSFLSRYVRSIEQLEILLLFGRDPTVPWTSQRVYDTILSTPSSVERWLNELVTQGLLEKTPDSNGGYRSSSNPDLHSQVALLAQIYRISPVRVIEAIYKRDSNAVQSFADAFKLKNTQPNS